VFSGRRQLGTACPCLPLSGKSKPHALRVVAGYRRKFIMKINGWFIIIFVAGCILLFNGYPSSAAEDVRLPDITKILTAYGCPEKGSIQYQNRVVVRGKFLFYDENNISSVEEDKKFLDTPEEFITAAYLSDRKVIDEVQGIMQSELPKGKIGGLRLICLWLKKHAEFLDSIADYQNVVNLIKNKELLLDAGIKDYFAQAIEKEILAHAQNALGVWYSSEQLRNTVCKPIIDYYINPVAANKEKMITKGVALLNENIDRGEGYIAVLAALDSKFASGIINKIHELRVKKQG
jgi:hypothetical protein